MIACITYMACPSWIGATLRQLRVQIYTSLLGLGTHNIFQVVRYPIGFHLIYIRNCRRLKFKVDQLVVYLDLLEDTYQDQL